MHQMKALEECARAVFLNVLGSWALAELKPGECVRAFGGKRRTFRRWPASAAQSFLSPS